MHRMNPVASRSAAISSAATRISVLLRVVSCGVVRLSLASDILGLLRCPADQVAVLPQPCRENLGGQGRQAPGGVLRCREQCGTHPGVQPDADRVCFCHGQTLAYPTTSSNIVVDTLDGEAYKGCQTGTTTMSTPAEYVATLESLSDDPLRR